MTKISLKRINFKEELKRIEQEMEDFRETEVFRRMDFATETLRIVTPVDTGEARSGWKNRKVKSFGKEVGGFLINNVEHIVFLNDGSSQQAPKFFIEQVLLTIGLLTQD